MSSIERLKQYQNPTSRQNWHGQGRDKENLRRWAERAHQNSDSHLHRARDGEIALPGGGGVAGPSYGTLAGAGSGVGRIEHSHELARKDKNHVGSGYMRHVRRTGG